MSALTHLLPLRIENTVLRLMQIEDVIEFQRYRSDVELARYQGWSAISVEQAREFVTAMSLVNGFKPGEGCNLPFPLRRRARSSVTSAYVLANAMPKRRSGSRFVTKRKDMATRPTPLTLPRN